MITRNMMYAKRSCLLFLRKVRLMEQVDPVTEELSEIIDRVTADIGAKLNEAVNEISAEITTIAIVYAVSSVLYIIALCFILFVVIRQMLCTGEKMRYYIYGTVFWKAGIWYGDRQI